MSQTVDVCLLSSVSGTGGHSLDHCKSITNHITRPMHDCVRPIFCSCTMDVDRLFVSPFIRLSICVLGLAHPPSPPSTPTHPRPEPPRCTSDRSTSALLSSASNVGTPPSGTAAAAADKPGAAEAGDGVDAIAAAADGALGPSGPKLWGGRRRSGIVVEGKPAHRAR